MLTRADDGSRSAPLEFGSVMHALPRSGPRRDALAFALACLLSLAAACRSAAPAGLGALQLSPGAVVLDIPLLQQDDTYACGLASITTLCRYWRVELSAHRREELALTAAREHGLSGDELCSALAEVGLETHLFQGTLDHSATGLYRHVDAGRPPLVMLSRAGANRHYCLVVGYDEPRENLVLLDPVLGRVLTPAPIFARDWDLCRRFTLLASGKEADPIAAQLRGPRAARADAFTNQD
ncbi:MAG: hypothetical protein EPO68_09550 [Planctomycetota bacterium]|nr:MAG: hypothetical protein EPO68_09550 [Planctomycetota bacterium]